MEAGFNSLLAVRLAAQLGKISGTQLPATLVFEHPTPRAIASYITYEVDAVTSLVNDFVAAETIASPEISTDIAAREAFSTADQASVSQKTMPAGCTVACDMKQLFDARDVNPESWRTLHIEIPRIISNHGGCLEMIALEQGSLTFFAPAEQYAALVVELQQVVDSCKGGNAGIPMTSQMLLDYRVGAFHMHQVHRLEPGHDLKTVSTALQRLIANHPMLRSTHHPPMFFIRDRVPYNLDEKLIPSRDESFVMDDETNLLQLPIDLSVAVFRARVYSVKGEGAAFLGLSVHHIVLDGPSQQIVYRNLSQLLQAERWKEPIRYLPYDEDEIARHAIRRHISSLGTAPIFASPHAMNLELPFQQNAIAGDAMDVMWCIPPDQVSIAITTAKRMGVTLNAVFLGTLATLLHQQSGQVALAIQQTYLGRGVDELEQVGSFSDSIPMVFGFEDCPSLLSVCQHVMHVTGKHMQMAEAGYPSGNDEIPTVGYELNDLRPMPSPKRQEGVVKRLNQQINQKLFDLFFIINRYADGYALDVLYDGGKFDVSGVQLFVEKWMQMWMGEP